MVLIATTREGKKIVTAVGDESSFAAGSGGGSYRHTANVGELKIVQALLQVSIKEATGVQVSIPQNVEIIGNSVKFTLEYGGEVAATPQVIAVGF